ncbi:hypothetical protein [Vibrio parahaemolyticus]|uniref:hypothetical protein n=2 Tax=Vibrio parahaemolyticus TaxID=670 RepID=UPI00215BAA12|nr:hypothetical protein [Vibrio parahaemolyticus]EKH9208427.1 hypothetical protein [Vibrio parahaemolyticus]MCR9887349.1 hypothetical protein [Vibrio parahaemolyticus]
MIYEKKYNTKTKQQLKQRLEKSRKVVINSLKDNPDFDAWRYLVDVLESCYMNNPKVITLEECHAIIWKIKEELNIEVRK